jgi:hypothetical protein
LEYVVELAGAEPRLQRRYRALVMSHLSPTDRLAAGFHPPPSTQNQGSAIQAAWRFYSNEHVLLPQLAGPLIACARADVPSACSDWLLTIIDWSKLGYANHESKLDRILLSPSKEWGYKLLTALAVSDRDGAPIAPLTLDLQAADGVHTTRADEPIPALSPLDMLAGVMQSVEEMQLGKTPVFIIDREADSVAHYRLWDAVGRHFLVRGDADRVVLHQESPRRIDKIAAWLRQKDKFALTRSVSFRGQSARQFVAQTQVVLHRSARTHRVDPATGQARHKNIAGPPLRLRLIVSQIRDAAGRCLAQWFLLTNVPPAVDAATVALWYYWRWRIESYHKLLKSAGQHVESWQQESADTLSRRLVVSAMATVMVWRLARDTTPAAAEMRDVLVRLSGRQMKRTRGARGFTETALLAGLMILLPMLDCLEHYDVHQLRRMAETMMAGLLSPIRQPPRRREAG